MSELQPGTRVRTAAMLSEHDWPPDQNKLRQAGTNGTIRAVCTPLDGSEPWYEVAHGPAATANYSAHELTPIRERASETAAPSPEQQRLDELTAEVRELRDIFSDWQKRVVDRLEQMSGDEDDDCPPCTCERDADGLLEQPNESCPAYRFVHAPSDAAVKAARAWREIDPELRHGTATWLAWHTGHSESVPMQLARERAHDALEAIPELLRLIERQEQEIDGLTGGEVVPERECPPRSVLEAYRVLHRAVNACWEPYERTANERGSGLGTAPGERPIREALQQLDKLGVKPDCGPYDGAHDDSGLNVRQADEIPEVPAPPPSDACREIERLQEELEQVRERLANMRGQDAHDEPPDATLAWIEERMAIMSELELFSPEALNDTGEGLEHLGGEESAYIGTQLYRIAALQDPKRRIASGCTSPQSPR